LLRGGFLFLDTDNMPHSSRHKDQKQKNFTLFAVLVGIAVVLFGLTVMKISGVL
jgi:zinc transporter ZupT